MTLYHGEMHAVAKVIYDKWNLNYCALVFMTKFVAAVLLKTHFRHA